MEKITALPDLVIGDIHINPPIIQGGMGVLVSGPNLASAVSREGALGVLAAVGAGEDGPDRNMRYADRSAAGLREMIRHTRTMTTNPIAVNIMCALSNYDELVQAADAEGISVIISGAGLPLRLPALVKNPVVKLVPVVSSGRAADIICRTWKRKHNRLPDAVIVEGTAAGGHLGFDLESIKTSPPSLKSLVQEVLQAVHEYREEDGRAIPVIAAGGVFSGTDIAEFLSMGASGVQMGTRFVCTDECDASLEYKNSYINCTEDDIIIIKSPVQLPLRVIRNPFVDKIINGGKSEFRCQYHCLSTCEPEKSSYCIANALKNASLGHMDEGFTTCGANAHRIDRIVPVRELLNELVNECLESLNRTAR